MRTCFAAALAALTSIALIGCGVTEPTPPVVVSIRLEPAAADLITGETRQLTATPLDRSGNAVTGRGVTWVTIAPTVATVSQAGLVTAVGAGQAVISAGVDGATASAVITVVGRAASVEVTPGQATLDVFESIRLNATVRDANGNVLPGWAVSWASASPTTVSVASDGQVTPVSLGSANISATRDGQVGIATITVIRLPVEAVSVSPSPVSLIGNRDLQLTATVLGPSGKVLLGRPIVWSSSNPLVASVSQTGLVTSHSPGDATITAEVEGNAAQAPLRVFAGISYASVTSGDQHTCSLSAEGAAFCWGDNGFAQLGSVGETCDGGFYYYDYPCARDPKAVVSGVNFVELTAGGAHTCGLSSGAQAYCWGSGGSGQLGRGSLNGSMAPVAVLGGLSFSRLSAGYDFTCGLTFAGAAYCWGNNAAGQLGDATFLQNRTAPVAVAGGLSFVLLSSGGQHTCGITTGARLYCWGLNGSGQLGDGSLASRSIPVAVLGNLSVFAVEAGGAHTCALTTAGEASCWGNNGEGALGTGTILSSAIPVSVVGGLSWKMITAGSGFTCGIASDDRAHCWGNNGNGQLGIGSTLGRATPAPVDGGRTFGLLSAGGYHTCGRTTSGGLFCWGAGWSGQLGIGLLDFRTVPTKVLGQP